MAEQEVSPSVIANREHIAPTKTGDNIAAKKVANYDWDGANWQRSPLSMLGKPFDSFQVNAIVGTIDSYTFYQGGLSGTLVATLTITYTDSSHATLVSVVKS